MMSFVLLHKSFPHLQVSCYRAIAWVVFLQPAPKWHVSEPPAAPCACCSDAPACAADRGQGCERYGKGLSHRSLPYSEMQRFPELGYLLHVSAAEVGGLILLSKAGGGPKPAPAEPFCSEQLREGEKREERVSLSVQIPFRNERKQRGFSSSLIFSFISMYAFLSVYLYIKKQQRTNQPPDPYK